MKHTAHGFWLEEAGEVAPMPELVGNVSADVLVIGGGYTGMWAAWQVKVLEPEARVVLLESEVCGHGPSGRNGGFCNSMWFSLPNMRARWGDEAALAVARAARDAIDGVEAFCREEGVDAWFRRGGYLQVSTAPAHDGVWDEAVVACQDLEIGNAASGTANVAGGTANTGGTASTGGTANVASGTANTGGTASTGGGAGNPAGDAALGRRVEPVRSLSHDEVAARCASPAFRGGAFYPDAATVQPARLAHGLRERLLAAGVEIYEHSPVRRLAAGDFVGAIAPTKSDARIGGAVVTRTDIGGGVVARTERGGGVVARTDIGGGVVARTERGDEAVARTDRGVVRAGAAIIAIGGAAKAPGAPLRNALTVTSSHIVLTEPVPELLEEIGWTGGECITDSRTLIDYFRTTPDGRIAFGWGGGRIAMGARLHGRAEFDPDVVAAAAARLREYFPGLTGKRITHAWGGPVDASPTHIPIVVPLHGGGVRGDYAGAAAGGGGDATPRQNAKVFVAAGYTGNGVGPSYMVGRTLASLALDRRDEHSRLAIVDPAPRRVPPEPFHWLGGETIRRALVSKENAELADRAPDPLSALITKIPRLVGFHIGR